MFRRFHMVFAISITCLPVLAAVAAQTHVSAGSVWRLNLVQSDFGGGPPMRSDEFVILVDTATRVKWTDKMVDDKGKTWKTAFDGPVDGTMHPISGQPGAKFSVKAAEDTNFLTTPDGTTTACTFSASADQKKYFEKCIVSTKSGKKFKQTMVYDRIK
jgi:hypothetical protein